MKKLFLSVCLFLALSVATHAQITFTSASFPVVGDSLHYGKADTTGFNPGASGAGVTWNFTGLTFFDSTVTSYKLPTSMPNGTTFTNGDVGLTDLGGNYEFFDVLADSTNILGERSRTNTLITYTNTAKIFTYPFAFNNTFSDSCRGSYDAGGFGTFARFASVTTTYDGTGTLTTSSGTYSNCARVHRLWSIYDTANILGQVIQGYISFHEYEWYVATQKAPVMKMTDEILDIYTNGAPGTPSYTKEIFVMFTPTVSISELNLISASPTVFPNPTSGEFSVKVSLANHSAIRAELTDLSGKVLRFLDPGILQKGENYLTFSSAGIASGMYIVKVIAGEEAEMVKIFIQ